MSDRRLHWDQAKLLGLGAVVLSVGISAFFFLARDLGTGTLFPGTAHTVSVPPRVFRILFYGVFIVGVTGLVAVWVGWRRIGGILMALTALGYVLDGFVVMLISSFLFTPLVAIIGAPWMAAALAAFERPASRVDVRA